jgi:hypothetical protein
MRRNQIAKLPQYAEFGCGWFGVSFDHLCRVAELKGHANHFFFCFSQIPMGWLWHNFMYVVSNGRAAIALALQPGDEVI